MYGSEPVGQLGRLARELQAERGEEERLRRAVAFIVGLVGGCDHAGISVVEGRSLRTATGSDEIVHRGDALQYELDEGPCLDSVRALRTVISEDLSTDPRWPNWSPRAQADLGVHGMMSLPLYAGERRYGAMNLYSDRADAYPPDDCQVADALAAQIAVALAAAREIEGRGVAMVNRTVIGQAEGILMERLGVDADQAFSFLRRISQASNRKLYAVCAEIVQTRRVPRLDGRQASETSCRSLPTVSAGRARATSA